MNYYPKLDDLIIYRRFLEKNFSDSISEVKLLGVVIIINFRMKVVKLGFFDIYRPNPCMWQNTGMMCD